MKRKILLILNMAIIGFSTAACSDDETNYITCLLYTSDAADEL